MPGNFTIYGQAGDPTEHQYLCFLFLNNINEKVFLIMWFWFYLLIGISGSHETTVNKEEKQWGRYFFPL